MDRIYRRERAKIQNVRIHKNHSPLETMIQKHLHVIGIGGIGVSALARYYHHLGFSVSGSDGSDSPFLERLRIE